MLAVENADDPLLYRPAGKTAPRFHRILVIGISTQASLRRTFEDELVAKLMAAGMDALPSYRYIAEDGESARRACGKRCGGPTRTRSS